MISPALRRPLSVPPPPDDIDDFDVADITHDNDDHDDQHDDDEDVDSQQFHRKQLRASFLRFFVALLSKYRKYVTSLL